MKELYTKPVSDIQEFKTVDVVTTSIENLNPSWDPDCTKGRMIMPRIIRNAIRCKKCGDVIESKTVHDFKFCSCGSCAVDGGHDYFRRCGNCEDWEELSEAEKVENNGALT